jgi:hypothetical protein
MLYYRSGRTKLLCKILDERSRQSAVKLTFVYYEVQSVDGTSNRKV